MGKGRDKRKRAKALYHKPTKATIRKVAQKIIETLGDQK